MKMTINPPCCRPLDIDEARVETPTGHAAMAGSWPRELVDHLAADGVASACHPIVTDEILDGLPPGHSTDYVRSLLVEHGALPSRDECLIRFQVWAAIALLRITTAITEKCSPASFGGIWNGVLFR